MFAYGPADATAKLTLVPSIVAYKTTLCATCVEKSRIYTHSNGGAADTLTAAWRSG